VGLPSGFEATPSGTPLRPRLAKSQIGVLKQTLELFPISWIPGDPDAGANVNVRLCHVHCESHASFASIPRRPHRRARPIPACTRRGGPPLLPSRQQSRDQLALGQPAQQNEVRLVRVALVLNRVEARMCTYGASFVAVSDARSRSRVRSSASSALFARSTRSSTVICMTCIGVRPLARVSASRRPHGGCGPSAPPSLHRSTTGR